MRCAGSTRSSTPNPVAVWCTRRASAPPRNRVPNTAYEAITTTPGWVDAVVIMTGYNDWYDDFGYLFGTIVGAARAKGARQIVWLTYSEGGQVTDEDHARTS